MIEVFNRVLSIITTILEVREEDIKIESDFQKDLGADSLDAVELIMDLEDEFGIDIKDEEVEKFKTVGDVVNYLNSRKDVLPERVPLYYINH